MSRRALASVLALGLGLVPLGARAQRGRTTHPAPPRTRAVAPRDRYPAIPLYGANVGETLIYRPYDARGRTRRDALRALQRLLRCRQTGAQHRLHPRLGDTLYQLGRHFAGHRIEIYSGYRPRAYCNRPHSRHMTGSAIDFHVDGVKNEVVIAYLRHTFHPAGVGFYPHGVHVHLDVERTHDTYWVDPGPPASDPMLPAVVTSPLGAVEDEAPEPEIPQVAQPLPPPPQGDPTLPDPPPPDGTDDGEGDPADE